MLPLKWEETVLSVGKVIKVAVFPARIDACPGIYSTVLLKGCLQEVLLTFSFFYNPITLKRIYLVSTCE